MYRLAIASQNGPGVPHIGNHQPVPPHQQDGGGAASQAVLSKLLACSPAWLAAAH